MLKWFASTSSINKAEGGKAYITKEDPKVIMARIVQRYRASQLQ
jgi:hypothetical protein